MSETLEFKCSSCNSITNGHFVKPGELHGWIVVKCMDCEKELTVRGKVPETWTPSPRHDRREVPSVTDYGTLRVVGKINSIVGWLVVLVGFVLVVGGMEGGGQVNLAIILPGIGIFVVGLLVVASGQMISCFVDTERHTRASSETLKLILEKMNEQKTE